MAIGEPVDLGPRGPVTGVADQSNPLGAGNWTVTFPAGLLAVQVKQYEVYKMVLQGPGGFFEVFRNTDWWDTSLLATRNSWDPQQPLLMRQADSLFFYWSVATGTAPMVTIWLRYSPGL